MTRDPEYEAHSLIKAYGAERGRTLAYECVRYAPTPESGTYWRAVCEALLRQEAQT